MKKKSITLGVLFCIFILCSLTYQPIVANESLDTKLDEKGVSYNNHLDKININSIIKLLLRSKILGNDCGCDTESKVLWPFPILCSILLTPYIISTIGWFIFKLDIFRIINTIIYVIGEILGCPWT